VVARKNSNGFLPRGGIEGVPDTGNALGKLFKPAQASPGYGHQIKPVAGLLQQCPVKRLYGVQHVFQFAHHLSVVTFTAKRAFP
jgi:hypothetical protein